MNTQRFNLLAICAAASLALLCLGAAGPMIVTVTRANLDGRLFAASLATAMAGVYLAVVSSLIGLMRAAGQRQWDWCVAVVALGPVGTLLYSLCRPGAGAFGRSSEPQPRGI